MLHLKCITDDALLYIISQDSLTVYAGYILCSVTDANEWKIIQLTFIVEPVIAINELLSYILRGKAL